MLACYIHMIFLGIQKFESAAFDMLEAQKSVAYMR